MADFFESFVLKCFDYVSNIFDFADTPVLNEFGNKDTAEILSQVDDGKEKPLYRDPLFLITVSVILVSIGLICYYYSNEIKTGFSFVYESTVSTLANPKTESLPELSTEMQAEITRFEFIRNYQDVAKEESSPELAQIQNLELTNSQISSFISRLDNPRFNESEIGPIVAKLENPKPLRMLSYSEFEELLAKCIVEDEKAHSHSQDFPNKN